MKGLKLVPELWDLPYEEKQNKLWFSALKGKRVKDLVGVFKISYGFESEDYTQPFYSACGKPHRKTSGDLSNQSKEPRKGTTQIQNDEFLDALLEWDVNSST